jgi:(R,R)-butanediol dehydrogenase / meso-butanediol dehydrogenase / diacetyl reductase
MMRAAVYHGRRDVRIESRPIPVPGPGALLVRVTRCGICGTDAGEYAHGPRMFATERRHPGSRHLGPMVLGHEFVGEVIGQGRAVTGEWIGRRVASGAGVSCGECRWCRGGRTNLCARYWTLGLNADGGLAGYVAVPAATCAEIPAGLGDDAAALAQPLAVGLHAVRRAAVRPDETVVLLGAGAIGSFILSALLAEPVGRLIVFDVDAARLTAARALGATDTVLARGADAVEALGGLVGDEGADVVIEASGAPGSTAQALAMAARGGRLLLVGLAGEPQRIDLADATLREVDLRTTVAHVGRTDLPAALELLAARDLAPHLIDRVIPIGDVVTDGLEAMLAGTVSGKVLIDPHA